MQEELLNQVVAQMEEWSGMYGEYAYVFMAAFILAVDDTAFCWVGTTKVQTTILEGQHNYLFESEDTEYLCLGIVIVLLPVFFSSFAAVLFLTDRDIDLARARRIEETHVSLASFPYRPKILSGHHNVLVVATVHPR